MNFLNDSLKTLKNVLAEGLEQKVDFDGSSSETGENDVKANSSSDSENMRKLCQHQSEEVHAQCFYYCAVSSVVVFCT